jgi:A-kinase anchor protein 13
MYLTVYILFVPRVGSDENMSNTWKFLSHSTDSLNKICKVNESTESLTDEGKRELLHVLLPTAPLMS